MKRVWKDEGTLVHSLLIGEVREPVAEVTGSGAGTWRFYVRLPGYPGDSNPVRSSLEEAKRQAEIAVSAWFLAALEIVP